MRQRKFLIVLAALLFIAVPAVAVFTGMNLDATLSNLRRELLQDYRQISRTQDQLRGKYELQHQQMVEIVKKCNDLSLMLYSQKQDYTFDISYALEKVTREYNDFNKNRTPYDRVVSNLNIEIGRYARLIEALRRLPPELVELEVVPDSLAYHNDTLDAHLRHNESLLQQALQEQVDSILALNAHRDTLGMPAFILGEAGQTDRDSCLFYASELLKLYARTREEVMADSTHYREARLRMEESYAYARDYYDILENKVFVEGQTPWWAILSNPGGYWEEAWRPITGKYNLPDVAEDFQGTDTLDTEDSRVSNLITLIYLPVYILFFLILWGLAALLMLPVYRFAKPVGRAVAREQRRYVALLLGCTLFLILSTETTLDDRGIKAIRLMHTFIWLLMAITAALLVRLKPAQLKKGFRNYLPTVVTALSVISCRVLFLPNAIMNFLFPPLLLVMVLWQFVANLRRRGISDRADVVISWISFGITAVAAVFGWIGYIFLALIILVWWYFQLAVILALASVWKLTDLYKKEQLDKRLSAQRAKITYVTGEAKEQLLFTATWFYELARNVLVPLLAILSIPGCIFLALNVFEFNDLFRSIFEEPFLRQGEFRVSLYDILFLTGLFILFRYLNKAIHVVWQRVQYLRFLRKHKRKTVRSNEINLSLGNSLISVFIWFVYIDLFIVTLHIPTDSLGLVAGGLSAGIGLALKDIINNFIYGIQLMGGRLRVGDWIDCDGVRGKVTDISYQTTMVETLYGTQVAFLNSSLFGKSFTNLTRNNSYELTIVKVGVAYGTDFQKVRAALEDGLQVLRTKDSYGRDIVEPTYGFDIHFDDFGESSVNVAVWQYVLVAEQFEYMYRCKEVIYRVLKENGITIPFPQRDLHIIKDDKKLDL